MDQVDQAINALLRLFRAAGDALLAGLAAVEVWLRVQLSHLGVERSIQPVILTAVAILLLVAILRLFGGAIRVLLVVLLILLALHVVLPIAHV